MGNYHQSGTSKRRARSPLESTAKRERDMASSQALQLVPQSPRFREDWDSIWSSTAGIPSTRGLELFSSECVPPMLSTNEQSMIWNHPFDIAKADEAFTEGDRWFEIQGDTNLWLGNPFQSPFMAPVAPYSKTPVQELVFSRPAEFLAVRETEGRHDCLSPRAS